MPRTRRARRGSALILVLLMTLAVAGLSIAVIFLSSSSGLVAATADREREFRYAALAGLDLARDTIQRFGLSIPNSDKVKVIDGRRIRDAGGTELPRIRVDVWASGTGDTSGTFLPTITLIAQAYDLTGIRHVQRADLRREALSRYAIFADGDVSHGPGVVPGRAHANGTWTVRPGGRQVGNIFLDSLTASGTISSSGATLVRGSLQGLRPIAFPRDSVFPWMRTIAQSAGLDLTTSASGTRLEFVALDADADGVVEEAEGFFRILDLSAVAHRRRLRVRPVNTGPVSNPVFSGLDVVVQHQCGAFYRRPTAAGGFRWHFLPVSAHRRAGFQSLIQSAASGSYPAVSSAVYAVMLEHSEAATKAILTQPTARCFPVGSPYLMPSERFTDATQGGLQGGATHLTPWGNASTAPVGGWYGGSDTTHSGVIRTCTINDGRATIPGAPGGGSGGGGSGGAPGGGGTPNTNRGGCVEASGPTVLAAWRVFPGVRGTALADTAHNRYLWPLSKPYNGAESVRGVVNVTVPSGDTLFLNGVLRGHFTLRVAPVDTAARSHVVFVDRLTYAEDPNRPEAVPCANEFGLIARGDVLVVSGLTSRLFVISNASNTFNLLGGGEPRFTLHGSLLSLTGGVGVEGPSEDFGPNGAQLDCPDDEAAVKDDSNGGCLSITGGIAMRRYLDFYTAGGRNTTNTSNGMRYAGNWDRCTEVQRRPPFFPVTSRAFLIRTLEIGVTRANTLQKIDRIFAQLRGRPL